jgi:hypothetical protein
MNPYTITLEMRGSSPERTLTLWGKDRDDVIEFTKKVYRKVLVRVKSARRQRG